MFWARMAFAAELISYLSSSSMRCSWWALWPRRPALVLEREELALIEDGLPLSEVISLRTRTALSYSRLMRDPVYCRLASALLWGLQIGLHCRLPHNFRSLLLGEQVRSFVVIEQCHSVQCILWRSAWFVLPAENCTLPPTYHLHVC
jgi:hypothetical protein